MLCMLASYSVPCALGLDVELMLKTPQEEHMTQDMPALPGPGKCFWKE